MINLQLALAAASGALLGFLLGIRLSSMKKRPVPEKLETVTTVLFFPDVTNAIANQTMLSREQKGMLYKEILDNSSPLDIMIGRIARAELSVDLCLFIITCHKLGKAVLEQLEKAKVKVRLITDESNAHMNGSLVGEMRRNGAFVRMKKNDYLMHHKFAIIDANTVLTGSFNWTMQAAMGNQENVIISSDPCLVQPFSTQFEKMWNDLGY